ncbi:MAG: hypothetical protein IT233_06140 [Bacteroidia bacterium]|nr:hypothetical protein [Bacteroidia bacterium]
MWKRRLIITVFFLALLTPLWMYLAWLLRPPHPMNIFILDKTVLTKSCDEHRSLNWVLTNEKIVRPDTQLYVTESDYSGFFPLEYDQYEVRDIEKLSAQQVDSMANVLDMVYYTDIYGIYWNDWYQEGMPVSEDERILNLFKNLFGKKAALERSPLIYGGLHANEVELLREMKERKKLILTEFNLLASPSNGPNRKKVEQLFGFTWSGWVGRYFISLDTLVNPEIPPWVVRLYKEQHQNTWPFHKSGIVLVHEDETIAILEDETHLEADVPAIVTTDQYQDEYGLPYRVIYPFWFDVINTGDSNAVISWYELSPNKKGDSILNKNHIPSLFPAVIKRKSGFPFWYMAGDFSDNPIRINYMSRLRGIKTFRYFMYDKGDKSDRNRFFWNYYSILVPRIIRDYQNEMK